VAVLVDRLEVSYCEGWDPQIRAAIGPVSPARAADRDRAGEQYAVLLAVSGVPLAIIEVAWRDHYCGMWFFDEQLRRVFEVERRLLGEGRLFVARGGQWHYADAAQAEFDERAPHTRFEISLDGLMRVMAYAAGPYGGMRQTGEQLRPSDCWLDVPQFGDWGRYIPAVPDVLAALGHETAPAVTTEDVSDPGGEGLPPGRRLWHPPRPLQPEHLDLLFTPGTRVVLDTSGDTVIVEVLAAGTLRMPSGRLVAADPGTLEFDGPPPFTTTVMPGEYQVLLSLLRRVDDPEHERVAAAKLAIRDDPVASWELALLPGADPRFLGKEAFFGFGVDSGMVCFFDAIATSAMARQGETFITGINRITAKLSDPESGANLIAFQSGPGDGCYPTWIGRTSSGDVACFIADLLLLHGIVSSFTRPTSSIPGPDPGPAG
jgi:hypothetical protein